MGGMGSGRSWGFRKTTTNEMSSIELPWLKKNKMLIPGHSSTISWSRRGETYSSIGYSCELGGFRLRYRSQRNGEDWQSINDFFPFTYTSTNFNGKRRWIVCPSCGRRCGVLYGGRYYRCRKCYDLKYESQYEPPWGRAINRSIKIKDKLGGSGGIDDTFPPKPKGMHWKTYHKLEAEYEHGYEVWARLCMNWLDRYGIK